VTLQNGNQADPAGREPCGRRVVITGAARDFGRTLALFFSRRGDEVLLSPRLRPHGVRVISLYPPDFSNPDPLGPDWDTTPRGAGDKLTAHSLVECVMFAIDQPRDCFIKAFHFEQTV
jgi:hypothetical protein